MSALSQIEYRSRLTWRNYSNGQGCWELKMETMREPLTVYSSSLSGKAGLLDETKLVLQYLATGQSIDDVRGMVVEQNLLSKQSPHTRQAVWDAIRLRLAGMGDDHRIRRVARVVTSPQLTVQAQNLILFYELCRSQPLLADLTADCLYPLYAKGRSVIDKTDVITWLSFTAEAHTEIATWSPQTREKIASNYLSLVRDFGLLNGVQQKHFTQVYIPLPAFAYMLYDLHEQGLGTKDIIDSPAFRMLLIDHDDLMLLFADAARSNYVTFRRTGTIYDLVFHYASVDEVMERVTSKVS